MLRNDFDKDELIKWFVFNKICWVCGRQHADSHHHILGRISNSILNAAPVNNFDCHLNIHGRLTLKKNQIELLRKTYEYLLEQGYKLKKKDRDFIEKHKEFYPWITD